MGNLIPWVGLFSGDLLCNLIKSASGLGEAAYFFKLLWQLQFSAVHGWVLDLPLLPAALSVLT